MPNTRCPSCCKTFPNNTQLLQHMNQPRGHCIINCLCIEPPDFILPDPDGDGDIDDGWSDIDLGLDLAANDLAEEASNPIEARIGDPEPFIEFYPGASADYGHGHTFMDTFDTDRHVLERQNNLFYPFASKMEWQVTSWLANSGLSMAAINECLSLDIVRPSPDP